MKKLLVNEIENELNEISEENIIEIKSIKNEKKSHFNYFTLIIIFGILDILSFLLLIISIFILNVKTLLIWIFIFLFIIFSILLIIIILKIKNDKKFKELRILEEEIKRIEEERKRKEEEIKRKEEEKLNEMKKKLLEKQKNLRENKVKEKEILTEEEKNEKINEVLEDMCIYGNIMKKEIKEQKEKSPEKFIKTTEALQTENEDPGLFALGLISQNLENMGIETAIEKNQEDVDAATTCLQFISNGMLDKKKYDLHFEFGEERNEELLNNEEEYEKFKENLKLKLSKDFNIPLDKIVITLPQKGSFHVQVIFQSDEFNNLDINQFKNKFKYDNQFKELLNLKEIHQDIIMGGCKLSKAQLDPRGNRNDGWGIGEKRGGKEYDPPIGWNGIGLKVWDNYGDNTWIGMNNNPGEWCVAYHGVGSNQTSDKVKNCVGSIYKDTFKAGSRQVHSNCDDIFHPGKGNKVGDGVYCTPKISTAASYAGESVINNVKYKTVFMVRVKPSALRHCSCTSDYWVVNGTKDEIRPYRILYKKC